jgi:hypothetical protein
MTANVDLANLYFCMFCEADGDPTTGSPVYFSLYMNAFSDMLIDPAS